MRAAPEWLDWAPLLPPPEGLAARGTGRIVTDHRTSYVREVASPRGSVHAKTYEYLSWTARWRSLGRRTAPWATPRAAREFDALEWLRRQQLPAPAPLAVFVWRRLGFVERATLVTATFAGEPADRLLPRLDLPRRHAVAAAIGRLVGRLHRLGFRDGNLDLRNLLVAFDQLAFDREECRIAKIDSPRFRLHAPGSTADRRARADWARLLPQLAAFDLDAIARAAAAD